MQNIVVYKFIGDLEEKRKSFPDFISAMKWQGNLLRKRKNALDYAEII